jgi:hypothetical protein
MLDANKHKHSPVEINLFSEYASYFDQSPLPTATKLQAFAKYARRQDISRFLAKNELFKMQLEVPGVIVECGSFVGQGLMTFAQLSSIYEPFNHTRHVIAFDTFAGFPTINAKDSNPETEWKPGDLATCPGVIDEIREAIRLHDANRPIGHIPKARLVVGPAEKTIPQYLSENPHLVVSMLYLDFDIYEPTIAALKTLLPRMPKGAILAFDELNAKNCPGETLAIVETVGIPSLALRTTPFDPYISYARL